jgi:hypothetical protein
MPLYFAYGANMDLTAMATRCPRSKPIGPARLMRHRLSIMREGWLTVERAPAEAAHGLLWDLALADVPALDRFEATGAGLYSKIVQPVVAAGGPKRALVYVGSNAGPGRANGEYIASVLQAAHAVPLPAEGLAALGRLARGAQAKRDPAIAPMRR